jgi:hypothetical protein
MVTISDCQSRKNAKGETFYVLILSGEVDFAKSTLSGNFYLTTRRASVTTTFDQKTCQSLIGRQIPGRIIRVECEPWNSVNESTGELIVHHHRNAFVPDSETMEENVFQGAVAGKNDLFD